MTNLLLPLKQPGQIPTNYQITANDLVVGHEKSTVFSYWCSGSLLGMDQLIAMKAAVPDEENILIYSGSFTMPSVVGMAYFPTESTDPNATESIVLDPNNMVTESRIDLTGQLIKLFNSSAKEDFEDGVESSFSKQLIALIQQYGTLTIKALCSVILDKRTNSFVSREALRWVGIIDDSTTRLYRFWLLTLGLESKSMYVRDGALMGLYFLGAKEAIPYIEKAIKLEACEEFKEDMIQIKDKLMLKGD